MPPSPAVPAPVTAVPRRLRLICAIAAAAVVAVMLVVAVLLTSSSTGVITFGLVDQVAVGGLGLFIGAAVMVAGASRVDADADGVRVRNVLVRHELPWDLVSAVRFDRHSSWASLELTNGDEVAVLAVQAVDRGRALDAVDGLRVLLAAHQAQRPARPPLLYDD